MTLNVFAWEAGGEETSRVEVGGGGGERGGEIENEILRQYYSFARYARREIELGCL